MMPSTPASINRRISAGSLTVHGSTVMPSTWVSAMRAAVTLRASGDQIVQPAACASRGTERS
jgi:hypothetical protein